MLPELRSPVAEFFLATSDDSHSGVGSFFVSACSIFDLCVQCQLASTRSSFGHDQQD